MNWLCGKCGTRYDGSEVVALGRRCSVNTDGGGTCKGVLSPEYLSKPTSGAALEMVKLIDRILSRVRFSRRRTDPVNVFIKGAYAMLEFASEDDLAEFANIIHAAGGKVSGA